MSLLDRVLRRKRKSEIGLLDYHRRVWLQVTVALTLIFLYAPILTLMAFSFNDSKRNIVWRGFTLKYYEKAADNAELIEAFVNSLTIAFVSNDRKRNLWYQGAAMFYKLARCIEIPE